MQIYLDAMPISYDLARYIIIFRPQMMESQERKMKGQQVRHTEGSDQERCMAI